MDMYRILESFDAVNSKQTLTEAEVKRAMHADADKMSRAEFVDKYGAENGEFWDNIRGDDEELDEERRSPEEFDADALAKQKARLAREKQKIMMQRKISGQDSGEPPVVRDMSEADVEEGNRFAYNVLKAKAAGKTQADLDGDGDMETVREVFPGTPEYELRFGKDDAASAFDKKKISTGTVYSRKHFDEPEAGDDDAPRSAGRPKGTGRKLGAKGPSVASKLLKGKGGLKEHDDEIDIADRGEYDQEGKMARQDLHTMVDAARELHAILGSDENLPEWVQSKITKALDYIDTARDYMQSVDAERIDQPVAEIAPVIGAMAGRALAGAAGAGSVGQALGGLAGRAVAGAMNSGDDEVAEAKSSGPDKGWVPNPDNPGYYIHRSDLPQTGKVSDPAKAKLGRIINKYFGQIYNYGDVDESLNYLDNNAPSWNSLFDKHDGDIDAIIANEPADVLKQAALELKNVADDLKYELDEAYPPVVMPSDQLDQQKIAQMKRAAATRTNSRNVQQQPPLGGPRRSDIPAGIRKARGDAPLARDEMGENSMGGTVAGGMAPAAGQKTFAEASSGSHEVAWKAAAKAVHAIMKKRGYAGSKTDEGYMWTRQTPRGTAFVDIDFDERDPDTARWGEGELKGAKRKDYYQSGNDNVSDLAQVIGELFANVKLGQSSMDEADEDGKKDKPNFAKKDGKHKPDDDGDGVPDWADKKPGSDDNEESDDSKESDDESDDDKELKLMKSRAGVKDKGDSDDKESDDDSDNKPKKGKKPDFGKSDAKESDNDDSDDDSKDNESDEDDSDDKKESKDESADKPKKSGGMKVGTGVYESAFNKSLRSQLREGINMNSSQDSDGKKSVTVTATDEDAESLGNLLKMAGLFSSEGYSSVCQHCGGIHQADDCGADHVEEDLVNSPDEMYTDADYMTQTLSGGLNGPKTTGQTTGAVVNRQDSRQGVVAEAEKVTEQAKSRLWNLYRKI